MKLAVPGSATHLRKHLFPPSQDRASLLTQYVCIFENTVGFAAFSSKAQKQLFSDCLREHRLSQLHKTFQVLGSRSSEERSSKA